MKRLLASVAATFVALVAFTACEGSGLRFDDPQIVDGQLVLMVGSSHYLVLESEPDALEWRSSDESVVMVSEDGLVEAVAVGTAVVSASRGKAAASVEVVVKPLPMAGFTIPGSLTLYWGGEAKNVEVNVNTLPEYPGANAYCIKWGISDPIVSIEVFDDRNIRITPLETGKALISGKYYDADGQSHTKTFTVEVLECTCSISPESVSIMPGQTAQFNFVISPSLGGQVLWSVDSDRISVDENGKVTAGTVPGNYRVYATCGPYSASASVKVFGDDYAMAFYDDMRETGSYDTWPANLVKSKMIDLTEAYGVLPMDWTDSYGFYSKGLVDYKYFKVVLADGSPLPDEIADNLTFSPETPSGNLSYVRNTGDGTYVARLSTLSSDVETITATSPDGVKCTLRIAPAVKHVALVRCLGPKVNLTNRTLIGACDAGGTITVSLSDFKKGVSGSSVPYLVIMISADPQQGYGFIAGGYFTISSSAIASFGYVAPSSSVDRYVPCISLGNQTGTFQVTLCDPKVSSKSVQFTVKVVE